MTLQPRHTQEIADNGYSVIDHVFQDSEITDIVKIIEQADQSNPNFRRTDGLFAIRQFLKEVPGVLPLVFCDRLNLLINDLFGARYFVVKSIYFDKPDGSNWFVAYHQDLTISVDNKVSIDGFGPWTVKQDQFAVQPPLDILQDNFTLRIHLDDTDEQNGALRVIPGSHLRGICRPENIDLAATPETTCKVARGGIMVMKPLLLHASSRTTNNQKRRVIHIEFSNRELPDPLQWSEAMPIGHPLSLITSRHTSA